MGLRIIVLEIGGYTFRERDKEMLGVIGLKRESGWGMVVKVLEIE